MIDLDQNATTPLDPEVWETMKPHWLQGGNPESRHALGRSARRAWEESKESVASILGARPNEVYFFSGGTEANNCALFGLVEARGPGAIVASPLEHSAVVGPLEFLAKNRECSLKQASVRSDGVVNLDSMLGLLDSTTRFATLMLAQNETGAIQPVKMLVEQAKSQGIPVHTDASQAVGRIPIDFESLGVASLAASAHKFHGPTGVGLLLVHRDYKLAPRLYGGGQQGGLRPGTPPVALAVGLAAALRKWNRDQVERTHRWLNLRNRLEQGLVKALGSDRAIIQGPKNDMDRLPQTLNVGFPYIDGDSLLMRLDLAGIAVSLGSACASGSLTPSPALVAMGVPPERSRSSVRFSFGAFTTENDIDEALARLISLMS